MSALSRGAGQWYAKRYVSRFLASAGSAVVAKVRNACAGLKAIPAQQRRMTNLQRLNDHALRDIGLIRDRFTGALLKDVSGNVSDSELLRADEAAAAASDNLGLRPRTPIERRQVERRTSKRRRFARKQLNAPEGARTQPVLSMQDRRAFDRRSSDHRIIDCRSLFSGRPLFLLS